MLTPDKIRNAFRNAIPARHDAFKASVQEARRKKDHRDDMKVWYPREVLRLAKDETRIRIEMAAHKIKSLLDSGWHPGEMQTIRSVYGELFSGPALGMDKDPYRDLEGAVERAVIEVEGLWPPDQPHEKKAVPLVKEFGQCWFDSTEEFIGELECYIPNRGGVMPTNYNFHGQIGVVQTGGESHITQNFGLSPREFLGALAVFRDAVRESGDSNATEIDAVLQEVIVESSAQQPDGGRITKLLSGLAQIVQTSAALPGAWNIFAAVASAFTGHPLPAIPTQ